MEFSEIIGILISLATLTILEIVLGVDNLVFISIISRRLPQHQIKLAWRFGLSLALVMRLIFLAMAVWITQLKYPLFTILDFPVSARDIFLFFGGLFLIIKGTQEIHSEFEQAEAQTTTKVFANLIAVVIQIGIFDIVFSLDSILTAVGLTDNYWIMATAIIIAVSAMLLASDFLSRIVQAFPTIRMLALGFLILIGMVLVADGFHFHIPRGYVYFAVGFSIFIEALNLMRKKKDRGK